MRPGKLDIMPGTEDAVLLYRQLRAYLQAMHHPVIRQEWAALKSDN